MDYQPIYRGLTKRVLQIGIDQDLIVEGSSEKHITFVLKEMQMNLHIW